MVHIKYCFNDGLPNGNMGCLLPICEREYFYELIITTKVIVVYAIFWTDFIRLLYKKNRSL